MSTQTHLAAILPSKAAGRLQITPRPTPTPGPHDLLIAVHAIALNPIDHYQRDMGFPPLSHYPTVLGSDIAGTVIAAGPAVPRSDPRSQPGARVAAFAPSFFTKGVPDYGAFQTRVLVPAANAVLLPRGLGFAEASLLPMAVVTAWSGWFSIGLERGAAQEEEEGKGMLVWGGAGSVGSAAVQVARSMGFTVYVAASERHRGYLKGLGAREVFDYRGEGVVGRIVEMARMDGVSVRVGFDAAGQVGECLDVLKELKGEGTARLATAVPLKEDSPKVEGVEVKFVAAPEGEEERTEHFDFVFGVWLKEKLEKGEFVPSPKMQIVEGGLEGIDKGLDELKKGVSGVKLVVEV